MERVKRYTGVYAYTSTAKRFEGRPDVCYYVTLNVNGKKERHRIGWRSQGVDAAYAHARRMEMINQATLGEQPRIRPRAESMTMADAWTLYYQHHVQVNTKTAATTLSLYRCHLEPRLGGSLLSEISPLDLEAVKAAMADQGAAPKSIEHALSLVRRIYRKMHAWGKFSGADPTTRVQWPRYDNRRDRWLTPAEARDLLAAIALRCRDPRRIFWRLSMTALFTGMRFSEVSTLRGESVNLDAGTIRVLDPKNDHDRTAYISPELLPVLAELAPAPGHLVFPRLGPGSAPRTGAETFTRAVNDLGLNKGVTDARHKVVFHTLRHTFGSWLAMAGVPLYWIAKLMGHRNQDVTERYSHLCPDVQRHAVACIDVAFHAQAINPGQWFALAARQNTAPGPPGDT